MKRKVGILTLILLAFSFTLYACKKPYENLKLTVSDSQIVLYLQSNVATDSEGDDAQTPGQDSGEELAPVLLSEKEVVATVSGAEKKVDTRVSFTQIGNAVEIKNVVHSGGVTSANFVAKNAGRSYVSINTVEGGKRHVVEVFVYRTISDVEWKSGNLAISKDIPLNLYEHVDFSPFDTNQKTMNFYISDPNAQVQTVDKLGYATQTSYAKIENGFLTIKDVDYNDLPYDPVNRINYVPVVGYSDFNNNFVTEIKNIEIINLITESEIQLTSNSEENTITLEKNALSLYEIILGSNVTQNSNIYKRSLTFTLGSNISIDKHYKVSLKPLTMAEKSVVSVVEKTNFFVRNSFDPSVDNPENYSYNSYEINQISDGVATLTFLVDYNGYEGIFTREIKVVVTVKKMPTSISVKNSQGQVLSNNGVLDIFNAYGVGVLGEELTVLATPEISGLTYRAEIVGAAGVKIKNVNNLDITNTANSITNGSRIYLIHNYEDTMPENAKLILSVSYSMAPLSSQNTNYAVYTIEFVLDLNFKIGLGSLEVPEELLVNAAKGQEVVGGVLSADPIVITKTENALAKLSESISRIEVLTFNDVLVQNIPNFSFDAFNNEYFNLTYNLPDNMLILEPVAQSQAVRMRLRITTYNGIRKEVSLRLFVPMSYEDARTPHIEASDTLAAIYSKTSASYNLSLDNNNNFNFKIIENENGERFYYNSTGELVIVPEDGMLLPTTYSTTRYISMTTNASVSLNFYNYVLTKTGETFGFNKVSYNSNVYINNFSSKYFVIENDSYTGGKVIRTKDVPTTEANGSAITIAFSGYNQTGTYLTYSYVLYVSVTRPITSVQLTPTQLNLFEASSLGSLNAQASKGNLTATVTPFIAATEENNIRLEYGIISQTVYTYSTTILSDAQIQIDGVYVNHLNYVKNFIEVFGLNHVSVNGNVVNINFYASDILTITQAGALQAKVNSSFEQKIEFIYKLHYSKKLDLRVSEISEVDYTLFKTGITAGVFSKTISMRAFVSMTHFNRVPLYAYSDIYVSYAKKVDNIVVGNVDAQEGIYFDMRKSNTQREVRFTVLPENANNKRIIAKITDSTVAKIVSGVNSQGLITGGVIVVERVGAGNAILQLSAQDSYYSVVENGTIVNRAGLFVEFRIKVADGTKQNPYEIRTTAEFLDINNANHSYYYVLAKDIYLTGNFTPFASFNGGLSGLYTCFNSGIYYSEQHTIYNLAINKEINFEAQSQQNDYSFGLFSALGSSAEIENLNFQNVNIELKILQTDEETVEFTHGLNVGVLAGTSLANVKNVSVDAKITVETNINQLFIGGLVGHVTLNDATALVGGAESLINSHILVVSQKLLTDEADKHIGGVVGGVEGTFNGEEVFGSVNDFIVNTFVASYYANNNEKFLNGANVGGLAGTAINTILKNNLINPTLRSYSNLGGLVGVLKNSVVEEGIIELFENGAREIDASHLVATNNLGGLVGVLETSEINLSYVRSFIGTSIDHNNYFGSMVLLNGEENNASTIISVGGLVGRIIDENLPGNEFEITSIITDSYFNANINLAASAYNANYEQIAGETYVGGLVGLRNQEASILVYDSFVNAEILNKITLSTSTAVNEFDEEDPESFVPTGTTYDWSVVGRNLVYTIIETTNANINKTMYTFGHYGLLFGTEEFSVEQVDSVRIEELQEIREAKFNIKRKLQKSNVYTTYAKVVGLNDIAELMIIENNLDEESLVDNSYNLGAVSRSVIYNEVLDKQEYEDDYIIVARNYQNETVQLPSALIVDFVNAGFNIFEQLPLISNIKWYTYEGLNDNLPLLVKPNQKLLFRVLPSEIWARVENAPVEGFNNFSFIKVNDGKVVLFFNSLLSGTAAANNNFYYLALSGYELPINEINKIIEISMDFALNNDAVFQPEVNENYVVSSANTGVVEVIDKNRIKTKGTGYALLTIASQQRPQIFTTVEVYVINGISNIVVEGDNGAVVSDIVYIDKLNGYSVFTQNVYNRPPYYAAFAVPSSVGFVVEVLEDIENGTQNDVGQIIFNDIKLESGKTYLFENLTKINITGLTSGLVSLRLTPFVISASSSFGQTIIAENKTLGNVLLLGDASLSKELIFDVRPKATFIGTSGQNNVSISPTDNTELTISVITSSFRDIDNVGEINLNNLTSIQEKLLANVYNSSTGELLVRFSNLFEGVGTTASENYLINITPLSFSVKRIEKTNENENENENGNNFTNEIEITFKIKLTFDREKYSNTANEIYHSLNNQNYFFEFSLESNPELKANYYLSVKPNAITSLTANYYAGSETSSSGGEAVFNPQEGSTNYIAPGTTGMLKLYLYPEFNDADFVEIVTASAFTNYVTYEQMLERYNGNGFAEGYVSYGKTGQALPGSAGIRLVNASYVDNGTAIVYNSSLFIRVSMGRLAPSNTSLQLTITPYKMVNGQKVAVNAAKVVSLDVQPLPTINLSYDGQETGIVAAGTRVYLEAVATNFEGDIEVLVTSVAQNSADSAATGDRNLYQVTFDPVVGKYYFFATNGAVIGNVVTVKAVAKRYINGQLHQTEDSVRLTIVEYIVNSVSLVGASSNSSGPVLEILNGTSTKLDITINATYSASAVGGSVAARKRIMESIISGKTTYNGKYVNDLWSIYFSQGGEAHEEAILIDTLYFETFKISRVTLDDINQTTFLAISGQRVDSGTYRISFKFKYYYDINGRVQPYVGEGSSASYYESDPYIITLIIKDNSTYDHPNPIYTTEEFYNMKQGVHYILSANITLLNHKPFVANFASLDGNGYVVNIERFDMSGYTSSATTGLFETISSGTIVKNLTVNIGGLLERLDDVTKYLSGSKPAIEAKINLTGKSNVVFGVIAGQNSGVITNSKVVNISKNSNTLSDKILLVLTTQTDISGSVPVAQIGTLVGVNLGSITNSFVGQNYYEGSLAQITLYGNHNENTYNFAIAGGKNIAGFAYSNSGTISNSYNKEVGVINISNIFTNAKTAGFIVNNTGKIYSSFVEGAGVTAFRANDEIYIEGKGFNGGFVYSNSGTISEAYSNITIKTNSGGSGGFVYENLAQGVITNAYSAGKNTDSNNRSHGAFTGVDSKNNYNNFGTMRSVFYLDVTKGQQGVNSQEPAMAISSLSSQDGSDKVPFRNEGAFSEFSFITGTDIESGIWTFGTNANYGPQLVSLLKNTTISMREWVSSSIDPNDPSSVINSYVYNSNYAYGGSENPVLISSAEQFVKVILESTKTYYNKTTSSSIYVYGADGFGTIRLVNNLNFNDIVLNDIIVGGIRISDVIFAGVLDGNSMSMTGISLVDLKNNQNNENFGLFNQIGINNTQYESHVKPAVSSDLSKVMPTIKNVNINIGRFDATNTVKVGALAGSVYDANLININLSGANGVVIQGRNLVGGIAGLIAYEEDNQSRVILGIETNNIWASSSYRGVTINRHDAISAAGVVEHSEDITKVYTFGSYYHSSKIGDSKLATFASLQTFSYAGSVSGVILGANRPDEAPSQTISSHEGGASADEIEEEIKKHRTEVLGKISNITVSGGSRIIAENVGGLFGYVGRDTHIMKSSFIIDTSNGKTNALTAYNYAGGAVGENYGMLEKVTVEYVLATQREHNTIYANAIIGSVPGISNLFGTQVSVAAGGLVGYADGSVILDSYSTVNVVNANVKIAGGLVGIATRKNYLSHVYTTGNVFAQYVIGGAVGLYNQSGKGITFDRGKRVPLGDESNHKMVFDYVVATNTWGTTTKQALRQNLQNYYVGGSSGFYNFVLLMPEIGNQAPIISSGVQSIVPSVFLGSLVGRTALSVNDTVMLTGAELVGSPKSPFVVARRLSNTSSAGNTSMVVSSTFQAADTVLSENSGSMGTIPGPSNPNAVGDIIKYTDHIGKQLLNSEIVGTGDFQNVFRMWTFDSDSENDVVLKKSSVWDINDYDNVFPEYIVGIYSNYEIIQTYDEFNALISSGGASNKYYKILPNTDVDSNGVYTFDKDGTTLFTGTFSGAIMGEERDVDGELMLPKVVINSGVGSGIVNIFSIIEKSNISFINFEVNFNGTGNSITKNILYQVEHYGIFAGEIKSTVLNNISLVVNISTGKLIILPQGNSALENVGIFAGHVSNSNINGLNTRLNGSFEINAINIGATDFSAGAIFGKVTSSTVREISIIGANENVEFGLANIYKNTLSKLYVAGAVANSVNVSSINTFNDILVESIKITVLKTHSATTIYTGGILGSSQAITLRNATFNGRIALGDLVETDNKISTNYVGGIGGNVENGNFKNVYTNVKYKQELSKTVFGTKYDHDEFGIEVYTTSANAWVGGMFGYLKNSSIQGDNATNIQAHNILVYGYGNLSGKNHLIGGIVAQFVGAVETQTGFEINTAYVAGETKYSSVNASSKGTLHMGGIVALGAGVKLLNVATYGDLNFDTNNSGFYVGGLIATTKDQKVEINNFIVYGNIKLGESETNVQGKTRVIGGVVANATVNTTAINGLMLARFIGVAAKREAELKYVSPYITVSQTVASENRNVYYIYEFFTHINHSTNKIMPVSYDNLSALNSSSSTYNLPAINGTFETKDLHASGSAFSASTTPSGKSGMVLPELSGMPSLWEVDAEFGNKLYVTGAKLNPHINANIINDANAYYVISANKTYLNIETFSGVLVGKKNANGVYPIITNNSGWFVQYNNGVLANFNLAANSFVSGGFLANQNNGIITNVVVTGGEFSVELTGPVSRFSGFVDTNSGVITNSGSSVMITLSYFSTTPVSVSGSGFVYENKGYIENVYSTMYLQNYGNINNSFAGLVHSNSGDLKNAYYGGYSKKIDKKVTYVENSQVILNVIYDGNTFHSSKGIIPEGAFAVIQISQQLGGAFKNNGSRSLSINFGYPTIVNGVSFENTMQISSGGAHEYFKPLGTNSYLPVINAGAFVIISNNTTNVAGNTVSDFKGFTVLNDINFENYTSYGTPSSVIPKNSIGELSKKTILGNSNTVEDSLTFSGNALFTKLTNSTIKDLTFDQINLNGGRFIGSIINSVVENLAIDDLKISSPNANNVGLIGESFSSTIKNINIANANVWGKNMVGVLAGYSENSSFQLNNVQKIKIKGSDKVGGLIGSLWGGEVSGNEFTVEHLQTLTNSLYAGGAVGRVDAATVYHNTAVIGGIDGVNSVGGLVGHAATSSVLQQNTLKIFYIAGDSSVGGLVGSSENSYVLNNTVLSLYIGIIDNHISYVGMIISSSSYVGGIIGKAEGGTLNANKFGYDTISSGTGLIVQNSTYIISKNGLYAGGLAGWVNNATVINNEVGSANFPLAPGVTMTNNAQSFEIKANKYVGGLIGHVNLNSSAGNKVTNATVVLGDKRNYATTQFPQNFKGLLPHHSTWKTFLKDDGRSPVVTTSLTDYENVHVYKDNHDTTTTYGIGAGTVFGHDKNKQFDSTGTTVENVSVDGFQFYSYEIKTQVIGLAGEWMLTYTLTEYRHRYSNVAVGNNPYVSMTSDKSWNRGKSDHFTTSRLIRENAYEDFEKEIFSKSSDMYGY